MTTWKFCIEPANDPDFQGSGWIDIISGDKEDAILHLEAWAEILASAGRIPDTGDWRNLSGIHVGRRVSKLRYRVRVDCFERETATGYNNGAGWLLAYEVDDD